MTKRGLLMVAFFVSKHTIKTIIDDKKVDYK